MTQDDFSLCMLANVRRAARAVSRRYDREARKLGMTAAQFSALTHIREGKGRTTGELAELGSMDRTTLVRNIALLQKKGLVRVLEADRGNGKVYELTTKGEKLVEEALPFWRKAQADLAEEMGVEAFHDTIKSLKVLSKV
jgi:DNA-binding MarR family transcriptional regulator